MRKRRRPQVIQKQIKRNSIEILSVDIFKRTGLFESQFEDLFQKMKEKLERPKTGKRYVISILNGHLKLLIGLHFLHHNLNYSTFRDIYGISESTVYREIHFIIPIIYTTLSGNINWPINFNISNHLFEQAVGAIDCSPHFQLRCHPNSLDYYCGDYRDYFFTSQMVVGLYREIWSVKLRLGHNNDQGMFRKTGKLIFNYIYLFKRNGSNFD